MKKFLAVVVVMLSSCAAFAFTEGDGLFQTALLQSLMQGEYDGVVTVGELKRYGDTGIGTFQDVNGEMIMLGGTVYRALWDGSIEVVSDDETVPFANVAFFDADITRGGVSAASISELKDTMTAIVREHGRNQFYMARVRGLMPMIHFRSELAQKKPYKPLNEALKTDQREFTCRDIRGTIVALYCPDYMSGLNTAGWHLHFISEDGTKGGHVLEVETSDCVVEMDIMSDFRMIVPNRESFDGKKLSVNMQEEILQVEGK